MSLSPQALRLQEREQQRLAAQKAPVAPLPPAEIEAAPARERRYLPVQPPEALVRDVAKAAGCTQATAYQILKIALEMIKNNEKPTKIRGFGTFFYKKYAPRRVNVPISGEKQLPEREILRFDPS